MKDAKGHGSNARGGAQAPVNPKGTHSQGVQQVGQPVGQPVSMQRRQYEAIAGAISRYPDASVKPDLAQHFANALQGTNPNFQAGKFKNAAVTGDMGRTQNKAPGMTRQHYDAVAGAISSLPTPMRGPVAAHFATELGRSNSNFNSDRFVKASGGTPKQDAWGRTASDLKKDYTP